MATKCKEGGLPLLPRHEKKDDYEDKQPAKSQPTGTEKEEEEEEGRNP